LKGEKRLNIAVRTLLWLVIENLACGSSR